MTNSFPKIAQFYLLFAFYSAFFLIKPEKTWSAEGDSLIFVIRVDDILSRNTTILPRSIVPFQEVAEKYNAKVTWGVMPHRLIENLNQNGVLKEEIIQTAARGHEISLHGYIHICQRCGQTNHEMYCTRDNVHFSYANQAALIQNGLKILRDSTGIVPVSFIPPGHAADQTTFQVLVDEGISHISTTDVQDYLVNGLFNMPVDSEFTWALTDNMYQTQLTAALADIRMKAADTGIYTLMMHDPFVRSGYGNGIVLRWMDELLDSLTTAYEGRLRFMTLTEASEYAQSQVPTHLESVATLRTHFRLNQNYPNPFNPGTTITYEISGPSGGWDGSTGSAANANQSNHVRLSVHDILGREINVLVDEVMAPGVYTAYFNAGGLPSGVYFYTIQTNGRTQSRSMLLLK